MLHNPHTKLDSKIIPPHGGYKKLESYKTAEIIYDGTVAFCRKYKSYLTYKTYEQMTGAARSGKQNIAEGSQVSGTSKKSEIKLISVARGSLEELLLDYQDLLRQNDLPLWGKDSAQTRKIRALAYKSNRSYRTYKSYIEQSSPEVAANTIICIVHQANYLLDQLLRKLEADFLEKGGFTERLYNSRKKARNL